jgi:hypothetical protein
MPDLPEISARLADLLLEPQEALNVEIKAWLDLSDRNVQALLAKALIGLRNHGGGYVLIGYTDGSPHEPAEPRPPDLGSYGGDAINGIIARFAEPSFHCQAHLVRHPTTAAVFPILVVPGGSTVPVRSKSESPDGSTLRLHVYYTRRPGPASESPQTAHEWDQLLRRCLLASKAELLDAIRAIVSGEATSLSWMNSIPSVIPPVQPPAAIGIGPPGSAETAATTSSTDPGSFGMLRAFQDQAVTKWQTLCSRLPSDDPSRLAHGKFVFSAQILGSPSEMTAAKTVALLGRLRNYSGWPPFAALTSPDQKPYKSGALLESWLHGDDAAHSDFWRISPEGFMTLIRGYQEDSLDGLVPNPPAPGTAFELTVPVWRVGEFLLRVGEYGRETYGSFSLRVRLRWGGLTGRSLFSLGNRRLLTGRYVSRDDSFENELSLTPDSVVDALPEAVFAATVGLFEMFGLFQLSKQLVAEEIAKLRQGNF